MSTQQELELKNRLIEAYAATRYYHHMVGHLQEGPEHWPRPERVKTWPQRWTELDKFVQDDYRQDAKQLLEEDDYRLPHHLFGKHRPV